MKSNNKKSIGVFDSGFGGINILRSIVKEMPEYNYVYLGDTARTPYGTRSSDVVYQFTKQAVDFFLENNCKLIIFACNTASSEALRKIQQEYLPKYYANKKVLGVLIPAVEEAISKTKNNKIGVIATEGTIRLNNFAIEINKLAPDIKVFQKACPLLVPIVEAGEQNSKALKIILNDYLAPLKKSSIDTLILGCTHYGILENEIKKVAGPKINIISEENVVPKKLRNYLERHPEIEKTLAKDSQVHFYSTDLTDKFTNLGSKFFGKKIEVKKVELK
jgi:glutamate racemase